MLLVALDVHEKTTNEVRQQYLNPSAAKARELLGWQPIFTLDEELERTISWYEEFFARE